MVRWLTLIGTCLFATNIAHADVVRLDIHPNDDRVIHGPANSQQLAVVAHFSDGTRKDVTRLTSFHASDSEIASVLPNGRVLFHKTGVIAIVCRYQIISSVKLTYVDNDVKFVWPNPPVTNLIDHLVFSQLKRLQMPPSELCTDNVFLRRAYLDVCGILPTRVELQRFQEDRHPFKRARVIDELLERPEFADYWAFQWVDAFNYPAQLDRQSGAVVLKWFRNHVKKNTPLDRLVRDLLCGAGVETDNGIITYYAGARTPGEWADRAAMAFLGVRLECVKCHILADSRWTPNDREHFAAFFAQMSMKRGFGATEVLVFDRAAELLHPISNKRIPPRVLGGSGTSLTGRGEKGEDRLGVLADWVTSAQNPYFARTMVNRLWAHLFGRGIAHPPEMIHELPLSANDELLDALARSFVNERFDVKQMIRIIMNSRTYQLSSTPNERNKNDTQYFSRTYPVNLRSAVLHDAIDQVLDAPTRVTRLPAGTRAVHVLESPALLLFGPGRRGSECERGEREANRAAGLHILHGDEIQRGLRDRENRAKRLLALGKSDEAIVDELFLVCLARLPTAKERTQIEEHRERKQRRVEFCEDIFWAILNTKEFSQRR